MKTTMPLVLMFALTAVLGRAAVSFAAYTTIADESKFVLVDVDRDRSSGWLIIGQNFGGYSLVAFDRKNEVLSVKKGDAMIELPLKTSTVKERKLAVPAVTREMAYLSEQLVQLRKQYTDKNPRVVDLLRRISELERQSP